MKRKLVAWAIAVPLMSPVAFVTVGGVMMMAVAPGGTADATTVPSGGVTGGDLQAGAPIPARYLPMIDSAVSAAACPQLTTSVLAAQLHQESGFNPDVRSPAGAAGIAQFMPGTWPGWGRDENGDGTASPLDPADAIPAAARYDCAIAKAVSAVPGDPASLMLAGYNAGTGAVIRFNGVPPYPETQNYVQAILTLARSWATQPGLVGLGSGPAPPPPPGGQNIQRTGNGVIDAAVAWAAGQVGSWYDFGGTCTAPFGPDVGQHCDCSSLMQQAYAHAGVALPRTTYAQALVGDPVSPGAIQPGDLVLTVGSDGTPSNPGHVAMYVGNGWVVEAPYTGVQVHFLPVRSYTDIVTIRRIVAG